MSEEMRQARALLRLVRSGFARYCLSALREAPVRAVCQCYRRRERVFFPTHSRRPVNLSPPPQALRKVAEVFPTAIISGRSLEKASSLARRPVRARTRVLLGRRCLLPPHSSHP